MITKYYPPLSYGGTEKHVESVSKKLAKNGLSVTILAPSPVGACATEEYDELVRVMRFPIHHFGLIDFSPEMHHFLRNNDFDIIHFHTFDILCRLLTFKLKTPYVITTHGFFWKAPKLNPLDQLYKHQILQITFKHAKGIFCVSKKDFENVARMLGGISNTISYLPNGVEVSNFSQLNKTLAKAELNLQNKITIVEIGRFASEKGQHILLSALTLLSEEMKNRIVVFMAGFVSDANYFQSLKKTIHSSGMANNIFLIPQPDEKSIYRLYAAADIFVLPSLVEGLPLTLLEAWAAKCSVIISSVGGVPYIVDDRVDALLVEPNNSHILSEKLSYLITDKSEREILSKNGFNKVMTEFDLNINVLKLMRKYREIVS